MCSECMSRQVWEFTPNQTNIRSQFASQCQCCFVNTRWNCTVRFKEGVCDHRMTRWGPHASPHASVSATTMTRRHQPQRMTAEERQEARTAWEEEIAGQNAEYKERMAGIGKASDMALSEDVEQARLDVAEERRRVKKESEAELAGANRRYTERIRSTSKASDMALTEEMEEAREMSWAQRQRMMSERDAQISEENREKASRLANVKSKLASTLDPEIVARRKNLGLKSTEGTPWKEAGIAPRAEPRAYKAPGARSSWVGQSGNYAPSYNGGGSGSVQFATSQKGTKWGDTSKTWTETVSAD
ncbi:hypothetical protein FOA52_015347 [Chlamydomonas sp. UWO 241]|nr:hypothetical protein FOA52_015347 [Chlamydomonas sp. UWO 241]